MTAVDIETYRKTEATLRDRERELSQLVDLVPSHLWRLAPNGEPTFFNKRMVDFLGVDVGETDRPGLTRLQSMIAIAVHPDHASQFEKRLNHCLATGDIFAMRYRLRRADGLYRWMSSRAEPTRDQDGRIVQWYGLCHDIDDQMRAEEAVRKSEGQLHQIIDTVPALIWSMSADGIPNYLNKRVMEAIGADVPDLVAPDGSRFLSIVHPDDRDMVEAALTESIMTGVPFLNRHRQRRPNGSHRWAECRAEPMRDESGAIVSWYGVSVDIHDQMAAENALQRSEQQLQQMIDAVPVRIWSMSREGGLTYFNKRYRDHFRAVIPGFDAMETPSLETLQQGMMHPEDAPQAQRLLAGFIETGIGGVMRFRLREKDGCHRWAECRVEALRDDDGAVVQWYGVSLDIDDEVRAQEALREREQELQQLVDMMPVHIRRLTPEGEPIFFNKRLIDFFGLGDLAELDKPGLSRLAATIQSLVHREDSGMLLDTARRCFAAGEPFSMKYRMLRADGAYRWVDTRAEPLRSPGGTIAQWYVISLDIDDHVRAEEALQRRERQLRQLIDAVPVQIWSVTARGEPAYMNKTMLDYMGVKLEDYDFKDGMSEVIRTFHPDDQPQMLAELRHSIETGERFEMRYRCRRADGEYRWTQGQAVPLRDENGRIIRWYGVNLDIHDSVLSQDGLRERERELSLLVDMVPAFISRLAPSGDPTFFNKRTLARIGMDNVAARDRPGISRLAALIGANIHPEDAARMRDVMARAIASGQPYSIRYRGLANDGSYRWMSGLAEPLRDEGGEILQWYTVSVDIDDVVRAQEALREREKELSLLIEMVPVHIVRMSPDGTPTFFSRRILTSHGVNDVAAWDRAGTSRMQSMVESTVHPDDAPRHTEVMSHALATGEPYTIRYRRRRADGVYRWMEGRAEPLRDDSGRIIQWYAAVMDVDDEVRAQEALQERQLEREQAQAKLQQLQADFAHATRVSMLGELAASIAHEVNQPLAAIAASSQASLNWLAGSAPNIEKVRKLTEDVATDAQRAAEIVGRIRAMAAGRAPERTLLSIDDVIRDALVFLRHEIEARGVTVSHQPSPNPPKLLGDRTQLQQVIVNLAINAMQSMAQADSSERAICFRTIVEDSGVLRCSVDDSGAGIEPYHLPRVFESFFTTKESGMGMGLRICRSVIEAHGGYVAADNESSLGGARFYFTLPIAAEHA